jgi:L-fuconolactonase
MRIDAHQHFWQTARGDYGWLTPASGTLWRDYMPTDLAPRLAEHAIGQTILVQAAPTEAETLFLLDIAARTDFVAGVVGWTDFAAPEAAAAIARLAANPLMVGLRPMVQDIADPGWIAMPSLAPAFAAMISHGLVFDALVLPRQLKALRVVLERHPDLVVIVDHGAKPHIRTQLLDPWRADMAAVASHANTSCKLSGLVTEASPGWTIDDLRPVFDHLLATFGPSRLVWGSDWPVVTLAAGYDRWFETAQSLCASLMPAGREAIFGGNAARIYLSKGRGRMPC